jgi:hypothetical protein
VEFLDSAPPTDHDALQRAVTVLLRPDADVADAAAAHVTLAHWRAAHQAPVNLLLSYLRGRLRDCGITGIAIGGRQKRVPTILDKLKRQPYRKAWEFQDIGGARVVVQSVAEVDALVANLKAQRPDGFTDFTKPDDYLRNPRLQTGYRSYHFKYEYRAQVGEPEYLDGLHIELQLRTARQHAWSTANEVVGFSLDEGLKYGKGPADWLRFFDLAGSVFAHEEGLPIASTLPQDPAELREEFLALRDRLQLIEELNKFGIVSTMLTHFERDKEPWRSPYYLLEIHRKKGMTSMRQFGADEFARAVAEYQAAEAQSLHDSSVDVLLVSAENWSEIRTIYQNYFTDTQDFRSMIYTQAERDTFDNEIPPWKKGRSPY